MSQNQCFHIFVSPLEIINIRSIVVTNYDHQNENNTNALHK